MSFIEYAVGAKYGRFYGNIRRIAKSDHLSVTDLLCKFAYCLTRHGAGLSDYLNYELWTRSRAELAEYVTIRDGDRFYEAVSPSAYKTYFTIKYNFLENFSEYIPREHFLPTRDSYEAFERFCERHDSFFIKPHDGLAGHGVYRQRTSEITNLREFYDKLIRERAFCEEAIVQHTEMAALSDNSVNTVRVMTVGAGGKSEILFVGLRVGAGSDIDNFHAGGMAVFIDPETGIAQGDAVTKDLVWHKTHPVSGTPFDGFQLPNWEQARAMCLAAATKNPHIHVVGWDVAITPDGATFVEGNRRPGFDLPQMVSKRGRKDIIRRAHEFIELNS